MTVDEIKSKYGVHQNDDILSVKKGGGSADEAKKQDLAFKRMRNAEVAFIGAYKKFKTAMDLAKEIYPGLFTSGVNKDTKEKALWLISHNA
jgi:hypothetical protein